jgi:hypothetical protein
MSENSTQEVQEVIADFLEMGHVENIIAMFKQDPSCLLLSGVVIQDERFKVRMGMAVLFEELVTILPHTVFDTAIPSLLAAMGHDAAYVRGDAAHLLATIQTTKALCALAKFQDDPDPQIAEIVSETMALGPRGIHNQETC